MVAVALLNFNPAVLLRGAKGSWYIYSEPLALVKGLHGSCPDTKQTLQVSS